MNFLTEKLICWKCGKEHSPPEKDEREPYEDPNYENNCKYCGCIFLSSESSEGGN